MSITNPTYRLTLFLDPQEEGGFTITCKEIPGLITEADTYTEIGERVIDAFNSISEAYRSKGWALPEEIYLKKSINKRNNPLFQTEIVFNEISRSQQKVETAWL